MNQRLHIRDRNMHAAAPKKTRHVERGEWHVERKVQWFPLPWLAMGESGKLLCIAVKILNPWLGNVVRIDGDGNPVPEFSLQKARLYLTQSNFFRKFCLKRLSLQSLNSAIYVKFLRFVMLRKRIEVVTKKVLKLLCNFAVPLRASLMILVSWSSGRISISKLVCATTANLLIIS